MSVEIERKYLINESLWDALPKPEGLACKQCYLSSQVGATVRVRTMGNKGFITIKGKSTGISRPEFEYEIPLSEAEEMIRLFGQKSIEKVRYHIMYEQNLWEVDVFDGANKGLVIAEIELKSEDQEFKVPNWVGQEVSGDQRFFNSNLLENPYQSWD